MAIEASAGDGHGPIAVGGCHCAVGGLVAKVARGSSRDVGGGFGGICRIWRAELVGKRPVWLTMWWGKVLVGGRGEVGREAVRRKGSHSSGEGEEYVRL